MCPDDVRTCPCCGQPVNSRNDAEKYFKPVEEEIRMTKRLIDSCCFGSEDLVLEDGLERWRDKR